jgi:ATP-dependent exoDNAse (exonuclease V) alpha subunit
MHLNERQRVAIKKCISNPFQIICGYPGTGKSTIVKVVIAYLCRNNSADQAKPFNVTIAAPTGIAVNNLKSKCDTTHYNDSASGTLHRLLYNIFPHMNTTMHFDEIIGEINIECLLNKREVFTGDNKAIYTPNYKEDFDHYEKTHVYISSKDKYHKKLLHYKEKIPDLIVIDEVSMINLFVMNHVVKFCKIFKCRLIMLGDENQLPPIGPVDVLNQLINSAIFKDTNVVYLTEIMRQKDAPYLKDAIMKVINANDRLNIVDIKKYENMIFINYRNLLKNDKIDEGRFHKILEKHKLTQDKIFKKTQFLTPQHDGPCGCTEINNMLQNIHNPCNGKNEIPKSSFRYNDRVVRISNLYTSDSNLYANGETGIINDKSGNLDNPDTVEIIYDSETIGGNVNKTQIISIDELNEEFRLRYCMTIHKSQGSQYDNVVLFMGSHHKRMWSNNSAKKLLYTAISRPTKKLILIGGQDEMNNAQLLTPIPPPSTFLSPSC